MNDWLRLHKEVLEEERREALREGPGAPAMAPGAAPRRPEKSPESVSREFWRRLRRH